MTRRTDRDVIVATMANATFKEKPLAKCVRCGKWSYLTRKVARKVIKKVYMDSTMHAYRCGDYWHVGHGKGIRKVLRAGDGDS